MSALSPKKRPRILRSGESAVGCGGRSFDVAFIYPFSTLKKKTKKTKKTEKVRNEKDVSRLSCLAGRELQRPSARRKTACRK